MQCSICDHVALKEFSHTILSKYESGYYYCDACGFLQTEYPHWLDEAYSSAIATADTGLVRRNIGLSKTLTVLLFLIFGRKKKYLDVAGGCGLLTRLMRDIGFDFFWSDKYCENMFARGFEGEKHGMEFSAVTAFEVMEHVYDPLSLLTEIMSNSKTRTVIFSTELFEGKSPQPEVWWYYTFETGQHISFYQKRTLQTIADKLNLNFYSSGGIHILTDKKINMRVFQFMTISKVASALFLVLPRFMDSKVMTDHQHVMKNN